MHGAVGVLLQPRCPRHDARRPAPYACRLCKRGLPACAARRAALLRAGLDTFPSPTLEAPILKDANSFLECAVTSRMEAGDHILVYAQVRHAHALASDLRGSEEPGCHASTASVASLRLRQGRRDVRPESVAVDSARQ